MWRDTGVGGRVHRAREREREREEERKREGARLASRDAVAGGIWGSGVWQTVEQRV